MKTSKTSLLQNHWMQAKSRSSLVCSVHVACYSIVFWFILPWYLVLAILAQHWLQDRFALHMKWMRFYKQTTPDLWPVGPLCIDQSFHLAFIAIVCWTGAAQ